MVTDNLVFELISKEKERQLKGIELIASENSVSPSVMKAMGSFFTNKYAEGYPGKRYYGGCEFVDELESLAISRAKELFGVDYVNVQPHSGSQANFAVYFACLKPGDKVLGFDLSHGGHLTHGSPVNFSGSMFDVSFYGINRDTGYIDYDNLEKVAISEKPKMIIAGASAYSRDFDFKKFREISDKIGAILCADIAHPAGLIAKGLLNNPADYCHIITTTTHKTLRGPRGGMIMMGKDFENPFGIKLKNGNLKMMSSVIDSSVFPGCQGGPLEHVIASKAICFKEALGSGYKRYAEQVIKNSKRLAAKLIELGFDIISGGTDNHMMLVDLRSKGITGRDLQEAADYSNITLNKNMVPFDTASPFVTSGVRIGTAAVTSRGLKEDDMDWIAGLIGEIVDNISEKGKLKVISNKVVEKMVNYPIFSEDMV